MLERLKRRISRTKSASVADTDTPPIGFLSLNRTKSSALADERTVSKLTFAEDTNLENRAPRRLTPSIYSQFSTISDSSERTVHNNVEFGFLALPTEVLLALQKYLSPSSEVALRHACSRFFHLFKLPSFYLKGEDRFDFLCMTERDQDPTKLEQLVCGVCRELHPKSAFSFTEVKSEPLKRDCRQVWLCAHKALAYNKAIKYIKTSHEAPFRAQNLEPCPRCREVVRSRSIADRPEKGTSAADLESEKSQSLLITKIALLQAPAPAYNEKSTSGSGIYKEVFGVKDVANALSTINFPVCSHLNLGDPFMLSRFCRSCINTQKLPADVKGPPCISDTKREFNDPLYLGKCKQQCFANNCKTKFMFQARESLAPDSSGKLQIWLIIAIYRWLGPLQTIGPDATWRSHAVDHKTRGVMRQSWVKVERVHRIKQPMPNWEICLLNAEDCNVRSFDGAYFNK